jgi:hypothetical protein
MTIPCERTIAIQITEQFLVDLLNPKVTPRIPKAIRRRAASCLRHYPSKYIMEIVVLEGSSQFGNDKNPFGTKNLEDILQGQGHA